MLTERSPKWQPRLNAPTRSTMRTRKLTLGIMRQFCMFCAASRQLLRPTQSVVSPYRSSTDFASGSDCRARSAESAPPFWMHRAAELDEVKAALDEYQRAGYQLGITAQFVLMCQALLLRNEFQAALEVIDHGLAVASHNGERAFESELYRLKAGACVKLGATDAEVESLLDQALRTARSQQALSFELRAAIDLARLWAKEGKCADARDVILFTYGRFNEGFDTQDLIEAKAVLAQVEFHSPTDVRFSTMHNEIENNLAPDAG